MSEDLQKRIVELEAEVEALGKDLIHDGLTGLKTKAFFEEEASVYFSIAVNASAEQGSKRRQWFGFKNVSFVFFDIDFFKKVNDTHGHQTGDEVLKAVAETVKTSVREGDTVARWGGEEIALTLIGVTEHYAIQKAEEIRRQVENIKFGKIPGLNVTISAGVASSETGQTFDSILARADKALYRAKETGRNKVIGYSEIAEK
jgi:diguanylate cyclase (GGDEF)-like protein